MVLVIFILLLRFRYLEKKWFHLQNAQENCGGKYSAPGNVACAKVIQAIDNVSTPR